jgi:hypothetical protein
MAIKISSHFNLGTISMQCALFRGNGNSQQQQRGEEKEQRENKMSN